MTEESDSTIEEIVSNGVKLSFKDSDDNCKNGDIDIDENILNDENNDIDSNEDGIEYANIEDNIKNEEEFIDQFKLMSSLFGINKGNFNHGSNEHEELQVNEKIDNITDTTNLIYEEACAITITNDQIKDEIEDIKNKFADFQSDIKNIKNTMDNLLNIIASLSINK